MLTIDTITNEVQSFQSEVRKRVVKAFDRAEDYIEDLRPRLQKRVNGLREPVVSFVSTTVDSALEIRERGENLAATVQRDVDGVRKQAEELVKKFKRA